MSTGSNQEPRELAILVWKDADGELDAAVYPDWQTMTAAVEQKRAEGGHDCMTFARALGDAR